MMFVQSLHGISHNKIEDTAESHLGLAVQAFDLLAEKTLIWMASGRAAVLCDATVQPPPLA
jgi:beta-ureidopropionase / N-carbamoyl-L-amino-acid hydrolase